MNIPSLSPLVPSIKPDQIPLEKLAENSSLKKNEKISELSRQFEALLLRQILKEARQTVIKSGLLEESSSADIYRDMINANLAESISRSGDMGLAESLALQLTRQLNPTGTGDEKPSDSKQDTSSHE